MNNDQASKDSTNAPEIGFLPTPEPASETRCWVSSAEDSRSAVSREMVEQCLFAWRDTPEIRLFYDDDETPTPNSKLLIEHVLRWATNNPDAAQEILNQETPAAEWRIKNESDPHGTNYDKERASLTLGHVSDDVLANGVFMNYDVRPHPYEIIAGTAFSPICWMTAAKERIRWLSRALVRASNGTYVPETPPVPRSGPLIHLVDKYMGSYITKVANSWYWRKTPYGNHLRAKSLEDAVSQVKTLLGD